MNTNAFIFEKKYSEYENEIIADGDYKVTCVDVSIKNTQNIKTFVKITWRIHELNKNAQEILFITSGNKQQEEISISRLTAYHDTLCGKNDAEKTFNIKSLVGKKANLTIGSREYNGKTYQTFKKFSVFRW